jgi:hypothetical protein
MYGMAVSLFFHGVVRQPFAGVQGIASNISMFSRLDPIEETALLTRASRAKINSVRQARLSTGLVFEATKKAVIRSHELIKRTDDVIRSWGALATTIEE